MPKYVVFVFEIGEKMRSKNIPLPSFIQNAMQELSNAQKLRLELLWWLLTALLLVLVLSPVYLYTETYPFWRTNIIYILTFVTVTRYLFLLGTTFLAKLQWVKVALIFVAIPAIFMLIQEMNRFQLFLDYNEPEDLVGLIPVQTSLAMVRYIRSEFILFGVGSVIALVVLPFRMVISVWRYRNTGKP